MKKWISTILSLSLVIGMAALLHACGKPKDKADTTTESATWSAEPDGESSKSAFENLWDELDDYEDESYSYTERTTDEHYQEEYDALTLPRAVTTHPAAGTTRAQSTTNPSVRETTTQFMFTSPSHASTTKKEQAGTNAAGNESTKASTTAPSTTAAQSAEEETTMLEDVIGNVSASDVHSVTVMPRPQVTYLDRYVVDILQSGTYTVQMEMKDGDMPVQVTMYVKGNDRSMEIPIGGMMAQQIGLPASFGKAGKVRVIVKNIDSNPKAYVTFPSGYMEMEDMENAADMIKEAGGGDIRQQLQIDRLQYCGDSVGMGYVCETYLLPEENLQYNFYFSETTGYSGLVRWDVVDLNTKEVSAKMVMRLYDKVTDSSAFTVSGKKMDPSELEALFS